MALRKYAITVLAITILTIISGSIVLHFAKTKYYTGSEIFWYGAIAGFLGCLLLVFLVLIGYLVFKPKAKWRILTLFAILVLLALVIGIVWSFAKGQFYTGSDVFWYGAIAGFLATLLLVCLGLIAFLAYRLMKKKD